MTTSTTDKRSPAWAWEESVLACALVVENGWRWLDAEDQQVIRLSELLRRLPIHPLDVRGSKFRNANGVARKTADLATIHPAYTGKPTRGGKVDKLVVEAFLKDPGEMAQLARTIEDNADELGPPAVDDVPDLDLGGDGDESAVEGHMLERLHLIRERNPKLRRRKIKAAQAKHGQVSCEACGFNFEEFYGPRGRDYIECHHRTPLSHSGPTVTNLEDLALLCSNCHRIIHRRRPWLTLNDLQKLIRSYAKH